jgi:uncharacterized SAM-binding protein YcdF (DUF218 family)
MKNNPERKRLALGLDVTAVLWHALRVSSFFALIIVGGFCVFAHCVSVMPTRTSRPADAIVALTGDEDRISEAIRLLAEGKARRLLISGVNKTTRAPQLMSLNATGRREAFLFRCCVDLDKRALNTEDNAFETTVWVRRRGFRSLIVVTSTYHMPRTLIELRQAIPDVELLPYPVKAPRLETQWWRDSRTSWVLCKEYLKFITAAARFAANSLVNHSNEPAIRSRMINARMG